MSEPASLSERTKNGDKDDLKMAKYDSDKQSLQQSADIDPKLAEEFDLE